MQYVKTDQLKKGSRIGHPIYNRDGVLWYNVGVQVDQTMIDRMHKLHMYGIFILEKEEKLPTFTEEEMNFEQFQSVNTHVVGKVLKNIAGGAFPDQPELDDLVDQIYYNYGFLPHKMTFNQSLRSEYDFVSKHSLNVAVLAALMAGRLGLEAQEKKALMKAAILHDIGKLYAPPEILQKQDKLTEAELERMNQSILKGLEMLIKDNRLASDVRLYLQQYYEDTCNRMPDRPHILLGLYPETNILKVADIYDTLTATRPYKAPVSSYAALKIIKDDPTHYDEHTVNMLTQCIEILPVGSYVVLSNGEEAIVLRENPGDYNRPVVWGLTSNAPYDLSKRSIADHLRIRDCLMTSDNRQRISKDAVVKYIERIKAGVKNGAGTKKPEA